MFGTSHPAGFRAGVQSRVMRIEPHDYHAISAVDPVVAKAIGARRSDVLAQFLTESVLLSVFGGVLGVGAGLVGSRFTIVGVKPVVESYSVFLALGVGVAVGLFFGIYPANRAASLRPIEALRYE